jgi:tellurite resistance protein
MPDGAGRLTRDESFLLVGLLVADADGRRLPVEVETLLDSLEGRNVRVEDRSRRLVQKLAAEVRTRGLNSLLGEVVRGLPETSDRRWAFGLAVQVAYADRILHPSEVDHIAELGDAIGLDEHEVMTLAKPA